MKVGQEALGISFLSPSPRQMVGLALIQVLSHLNNFSPQSSTLCELAQYKRASARKSDFKKLHLWQIGLRYLDQRQALVAALPGAPHLSPFFRSPYHLERFVQCLTSRWASHAASCVQLVNSLLFLCHGRHSSVSEHKLTFLTMSTTWFRFAVALVVTHQRCN